MYLLLTILFTIKLYAHIDIFKTLFLFLITSLDFTGSISDITVLQVWRAVKVALKPQVSSNEKVYAFFDSKRKCVKVVFLLCLHV